MCYVVNRQVEYDEFKAIMTAAFLAEAKTPYFNWKNRFPAYDPMNVNPVSNDQLTPEIFVTSDVIQMPLINVFIVL